MKYRLLPLRTIWLTFRREQFWFPAAFLALFLIVAWLMDDPAKSDNVGRAFLGVVLPLMAGILAGYAVLEDPTLELQFSTPRPAWLTLLERLGLVVAVIALCALVFQAGMALIGHPLDSLGGPAARQLAWLIPGLTMLALGSAFSFVLAQTTGGALLVGLVWIVQVIARGWFISDPYARYFYLFTGGLYPQATSLPASQAVLTALGVLLLTVAWLQFRRFERFI